VYDSISKDDEAKLTNRQKRKKFNEKNKWPQHPKIQSMDQRAKAYIRVAGFGRTSKSKESIDPKLDLMSPEVKFGCLLGGTDQRKRHAAVNKLKEYLRARCDIDNENGGISELDLLKLWKGLWYTLYMADKVPVQDELSKRLAELLWCVAGTEEEDEYAGQAYLDMCEQAEHAIADGFDENDVTMEEIANTLREEVVEDSSASENENESEEEGEGGDDSDEEDGEENPEGQEDDDDVEDEEESVDDVNMPHCRGAHLASIFIRTFLRTIRREWGNMDKYRVDKFYTLLRLYLHEVFKYMATRHWNLGIIRLFNDAIFEEVLSQTPNGLRYHLIDITLEELARANAKAPMPLTEATFLDTLEPYFAMCQTGSNDDTLQTRVLEKVVEKFLDEYSVISENALASDENEGDKKDDSSQIFDQVHVGSVAQFIFELASDPETNDRYRKSLYEMHKKYMRRLKKVGFDVELDETHEDGEEEAGLDEVDVESSQSPAIEKAMEEDEEETMEGEDGDLIELSTKQKKKLDKGDLQQKSSKKKKKTKVKSKGDADAKVDKKEEETVMISISEQKHAKARGKKQKKTVEDSASRGATEEKTESDGRQKRVKFTRTNRSKSYKASIKALVKSNPPKTSVETPEKSILRVRAKAELKRTKKPKTGKRTKQRTVNFPR